MYVKSSQKWRQKILSTNEIQSFMNECDAILPQKKKFEYSVLEQYTRRHKKEDVILTREILKEKYPEYLEAFDAIFNGNEMYSFNMFIFPWHLFDSYMNWLFTILFELEKRSDINLADKYQKRVCAFMAERLQTVWIKHNNLKNKRTSGFIFQEIENRTFLN